MLISGVLLSEKHLKRYQIGLWQSTKVWDTVKVPDHWFWPLKGTTSILTHSWSRPPPLPHQPCQHLKTKDVICQLRAVSLIPRKIHVKWLFTHKNFRHWSVRFLCWQNLSCLKAGRLYSFFCSSWHNLVGMKITVRLHLLNRLFKCIRNSMCALLVH